MTTGETVDQPSNTRLDVLRRRIIAVLIFCFGFVITIPYHTYGALQRSTPPWPYLDSSWELELPMRLARGEFSGRDFVFTYGPLYQVVHALGLFVPPGNIASVIRFFSLPESIITLLCIWIILSYTEATLPWRAVAYLLWVLFWGPINIAPLQYAPVFAIKPMAGLLLAAACSRSLVARNDAVTGTTTHSGRAFLLWSFGVPVLTLYVFDLGVVTSLTLILAAIIVMGAAWLWPGEMGFAMRRRALWAITIMLISLALFAVALSLNGWNRYLQDSWQIASGYTDKMMYGGTSQSLALIAVTIFSGCLILILALYHLRMALKEGELATARRTMALIGVTCFSLGWTRYALTRSDYVHILVAVCPMLFLAGCFIPCYVRGSEAPLARFAWIAALPLILLSPFSWAQVAATVNRVAGIRKIEFDRARLEIEPTFIRETVARTRALPGESLYVWPYETLINVFAEKANPSYTLQSYVALSDDLERTTIARLQSIPQLPALLATDAWPVDGIENLTRTPLIFRYLLENYEVSGPPAPSFMLLQRVPWQERLWREEQVSIAPQAYSPGGGRSLTINFPVDASNDLRASDLLRLRLRARKVYTLGIGKHGQQYVTFFLSNGEQRTQSFLLLPDDNSHDVIVSASTVRDPLFLSVFTPGRVWRSSEHVTGIKLWWTPLDLLSIRPNEIDLEGISVLRREGVEILETSVKEQSQPLFWNWCYKGGEQHPTVEGQAQISTSYVTTTYAHP